MILRSRVASACWFCLLLGMGISAANGQVGDPTLRTDHPQYAGEGAFQTIKDCARFAIGDEQDEQRKAIALYQWILMHQFHLASPEEWFTPGTVPDNRKSHFDNVVYDANRGRFSYAYGLCGTVHAWNEPYWQALGMRARRRSFPGHVNSEIEYGGSWHAFDTDMAGLVFRKDGVVAGYKDIAADLECVKPGPDSLPCYPFAFPSDFNGMKKGWQQVARGGKWYKMYNSGYAAHPGIVKLRSGETFTRYFNRDHFGGPSKRRFWHQKPGGPFRDWTFVNRGVPTHDRDQSRGDASYCNAVFAYQPPLDSDAFRDGVVDASANLARQSASPRLHSADGEPASVVFAHFSPYVICGDPIDDANPMTSPATDGFVVSGTTQGQVRLEVSHNHGQSWTPAGVLSGEFRKDMTDQVKGRYGWRVRFSWTGQAGIDSLSLETTAQVSQIIYPRLTADGCDVIYRAASRGVVPVLPDFGSPEEQIARLESKPQRSANFAYAPRSTKNRRAYATRDNKPGTVAFRVTAPDKLLKVNAAVRFSVRVPPPANCDFHLDVSTDAGKTWRTFAKADVPADNEYSSGWVHGSADVSAAGVKEALVRAHLYAGGYQTGLIDAQFYGVHQTAAAGSVKLTYAWREDGQLKTHAETIPPGAGERRFTVPTGKDVEDEFIRLEAE
ncbi:MAG: hypothetical protein N2C14_05695 [Planctomycetales bacterium]